MKIKFRFHLRTLLLLVVAAALVLARARINSERKYQSQILQFVLHREESLLNLKQILVENLNSSNNTNDDIIKKILIGDKPDVITHQIEELENEIAEVQRERRILESKLSNRFGLLLDWGNN